MGKWEKQLEIAKEHKEKEKTSKETLGKFFYDLAKTSFTVMVAGSAVFFFTNQVQTPYWLLLLVSIFVTIVFASIGYTIIKR